MANPSHDKGNAELLPCPFCGGVARIESNRDWHRIYAAHDDECVFDADEHVLMYPAQPGHLIQIAEDWNRRATPPSPSTAPEVDERAAFEAWLGRPMMNPEKPSFYNGGSVLKAWEAWQHRAALASRPADVDDEGLPPLPNGIAVMTEFPKDDPVSRIYTPYRPGWLGSFPPTGSMLYTAEQYRQGQRDAVAADRARRGQASETTELLNNPPYGQPDLYSRLHTALTNEVELAKKFHKLPQWFDAVRGLVDWLERETGAAPSHTTNKEKGGENGNVPDR